MSDRDGVIELLVYWGVWADFMIGLTALAVGLGVLFAVLQVSALFFRDSE